jgi:polysaccharide deacetylase family protein (PEP-CTERM system associated)
MSIDLEEYFQVSNFADRIEPARWETLPSRIAEQTHRLLDLFDEVGCRATFFALGWIAERHPRLLEEIAARGHELASHGHAHDPIHALGPTLFRNDLQRARRAIEDASGHSPDGYRAPSYSITRRSSWALTILAEEGFRYDSSIFPVRHPRYGIPDFPKRLVEIDLGNGLTLIEFALTTTRIGFWNLPVAGGAYLRLLPASLFRWGFLREARSGRRAVLNVHPWEIDPEQPRLRANWQVRVLHYTSLGRTESRLRRLLREVPFAPLAEVIDAELTAGRVERLALDDLLRKQRPEPATCGAMTLEKRQ